MYGRGNGVVRDRFNGIFVRDKGRHWDAGLEIAELAVAAPSVHL